MGKGDAGETPLAALVAVFQFRQGHGFYHVGIGRILFRPRLQHGLGPKVPPPHPCCMSGSNSSAGGIGKMDWLQDLYTLLGGGGPATVANALLRFSK